MIIEVLSGKNNPSQNSNTQVQNSENENNSENSDIFITVQVDKTRILQGDYLIATIKLFTKYQPSIDPNSVVFPEFNGFFKTGYRFSKKKYAVTKKI